MLLNLRACTSLLFIGFDIFVAAFVVTTVEEIMLPAINYAADSIVGFF